MNRTFYALAMFVFFFGGISIKINFDLSANDYLIISLWAILYGGLMAGSEHFGKKKADGCGS
jgi:membrane protein insertase Oxa1/YidC/SpoIIIJ